jgi:hypothetical protein
MPGFADMMGGGQPPVNFQQAGQFQQTLQPQQPQAQTPPTTPQELEQRKAGWQGFIEGIQKDPAMRTAAFMTAAQMMRGPDMGESMAGGIGRALQMGTLAHSFMSRNQAQQQMEQQKMEEQRRLNEANIAQTQAQTDQARTQTQGMQQDQQFSRDDRPLVTRGKELKNQQDQFTVDNQGTLLQDTLANSAADRKYKGDHGAYFRDKKNTTVGAKEAEIAQDERLMKTANPPLEGEAPEAYNQRIAQLLLSRGLKNTDSVRVQAAQNIINNSDPGSPEHDAALAVMNDIASRSSKGKEAAGNDAWVQARNSVKVGEAYKGPDGETYIRKN